jgi:hypothetical protein
VAAVEVAFDWGLGLIHCPSIEGMGEHVGGLAGLGGRLVGQGWLWAGFRWLSGVLEPFLADACPWSSLGEE